MTSQDTSCMLALNGLAAFVLAEATAAGACHSYGVDPVVWALALVVAPFTLGPIWAWLGATAVVKPTFYLLQWWFEPGWQSAADADGPDGPDGPDTTSPDGEM